MLSVWYIMILNILAMKFTQYVGLKNINPKRSLRVIGGRDALPEEYPYVLRMEVEEIKKNLTVNQPLCTCACIKPSWSLTAAHCIDEMESLTLLGVKRFVLRYKPSPRVIAFVEILSMFVIPNYYISYRLYSIRNDIGILKTENIALPSYARVSSVDYSTLYGLKVFAVGYGLMLDDHGSFNDTHSLNKPLQVVDAMINKCYTNIYPNYCLVGVCEKFTHLAPGDSGGPIIHSSGIVGVITGGGNYNDQWTSDIGAITPVSPFMDWIMNVINQNV